MTTTLPVIRVVAGAIIRDSKLLAAQRPLGTLSLIAGKWEMPGGKIDPGESDKQALVRELQEELMVDVVVGPSLGITRIVQEHRIIELRAYACELQAGEPVAVEHAALRWVDSVELDNLDWASGDRHFLPAVHSLITTGGQAHPSDDRTPLPSV